MNDRNKKLFKNIFLMFLVFFLPKVFSFFLVPIYTTYLSTDEYGISDLIISTACLIAPFVSLATPSAILRYTIENKSDIRPFQISLKIFFIGMTILLFSLFLTYLLTHIPVSYLFFVFIIVGFSLLSDIAISYSRGLEKMKIITICGVGSSFVSIICNIIFIVFWGWGLYGFLLASVTGYFFSIIVVFFNNRNNRIFNHMFKNEDRGLKKEMLSFSIPLIFTGLSWWIITLSDRYFVSLICGTAENGLYSVANKIPLILQAVDNVFGHAWLFSLYDSYKTKDGLKYLSKVFDFYCLFVCVGASFLISINIFLSSILFSKDFFEAWRYVPPLLLSIVFSCLSNLLSSFFSVYKKNKISMWISFTAAFTNIILNWILINLFNNAMGAAIATAFTFFISFCLTSYYSIKLSHININLIKQISMFFILCFQSFIIIVTQDMFMALCCFALVLLININTFLWGKTRWRHLLRR